jgi:hypothetical protein
VAAVRYEIGKLNAELSLVVLGVRMSVPFRSVMPVRPHARLLEGQLPAVDATTGTARTMNRCGTGRRWQGAGSAQ